MSFFDTIPFAPRSKAQIELITERFLLETSPNTLKKPQQLDVEKFLTNDLFKMYGIKFLIEDNSNMEVFTEGEFDAFENTIILSERDFDNLLKGNARNRFTATHEGYHGIDHGKQIREMSPRVLLQNIHLQRKERLPTVPTYQQAEWQANYGASALLMPKKAVIMVVNDFSQSRSSLFDVALEVRTIFNVSEQAAKIRLKQLDGYLNYEVTS